MDTTYVASLIVGERAVELRRRADGARLAAVLRCCRPSSWARVVRRVVTGSPCCMPA
jgi:hypothetical protein